MLKLTINITKSSEHCETCKCTNEGDLMVKALNFIHANWHVLNSTGGYIVVDEQTIGHYTIDVK